MALKTNVSQFSRDARKLAGRGGKGASIFSLASKDVETAIGNAFITMVRETPQYSGTTAASWNIGPPGATSEEVREQPEPNPPLKKGHGAAIEVARSSNEGNLKNLVGINKVRDVLVINNAPGAEQSEHGPVRKVNEPAGMFEIFKSALVEEFNKLEADLKL